MPQSTEIMLRKKDGNFRKKVALCLRTWRQTGSIKETSKITGINEVTTTSCLRCSRFYIRSNYHLKNINRKKLCKNKTIKEAINEKHSLYRKTIASYLREWRRVRSIAEVAKKLNTSISNVNYLLYQSAAYRRRYCYKKDCSRYDLMFIRRWAKKIKIIHMMGGKCEICGNTNIFHLDFHHKNQKDKINRISKMLGLKLKRIYKEAQKCRLLCRNCHREKHNIKQKNKIAKKKLLEIQHETKCSNCGYDKNLAALEFHHVSKNKEIELFTRCSFRNNDGINANPKLLKELNKCKVLCSNCHCENHIDKIKFTKLKEKINLKMIDMVF